MIITRTGPATVLLLLALTACQGNSSQPSSTAQAGSKGDVASPVTQTSEHAELVFQADGSIWTQAMGQERTNAVPAVPTDNQHPDWSPDGSSIAFEGNFNKIWTVDSDGTNERERFACEEPCAAVYEPAWSPDGKLLAFMHIVGDGTYTTSAQLMTLDLADGTTTVVHEDASGDVWEYTPRWSTDGSRLVLEHDIFASNRLDESQTLSTELRIIDATTGNTTAVRGTTGAQFPDWSPTNDLIVFTDNANLFTIRPDGTHRKRLTHFNGKRQSAIQPTFSPDGQAVIFTWVKGAKGSGTETTLPGIVALDTGDLTAIREATGATHPRLRP